VNPYAACLGFAGATERAGAPLHERSAVRRVKVKGSSIDAETDGGAVRARWAIVATGYATPEFKPLAGRFRMFHTYVIATPPLDAGERQPHRPRGDVMLWDTVPAVPLRAMDRGSFACCSGDATIRASAKPAPQRSASARQT
jgi:glycine/D-amino acid oxidase-like deaminating enzyme